MKRLFLGVFGGFCIVIIAIGVFNFYHFSRLHGIQEELVTIDGIAQELQEHKEALQSFGQHQQLFDHAVVSRDVIRQANAAFWSDTRRALQHSVNSMNQKGLSTVRILHFEQELNNLDSAENELIETAGHIGFKDHGMIGRMRTAAHYIEEHYPDFTTELLSLRRHEKDFLMRVDPIYAERMHDEISSLKVVRPLPKELTLYMRSFDSLTVAYLQLFQPGDGGLFQQWNTQFDQLQAHVREQRSLLLKSSFSESSKAQSINFIMNSIAILTALICTVLFTRKFSKQVVHLQRTMESYIASNYHYTTSTALRIPKNAFGKITLHFLQLTRKIRADMQLLEDRVARRTKSLEQKNAQLELQHREMMDSLRYAQDLQQSLLVSRAKMLRSFQEALVFYRPKNLVGGDFYWLKDVNANGQQLTYFALADCTGHGVPGALLSVMGMNALDELLEAGFNRPAVLLNELRALISRRLNTHEDKRYDGMDIALFLWDHDTHTLSFAGAHMPLWILRQGTVIEAHGQRMPIGYTFFDVSPFLEQSIQLQANDRLLLFTDGITDQFGGINDKKLGKKSLRTFLATHGHESNNALFSRLIDHLDFWKGNSEQTDDCTLLLLEPRIAVPVLAGLNGQQSSPAMHVE